jgi:calcineurin-like phosphoesterase family protein
MNETIIRNHNERVKHEDVLFFVGDFCFRNSAGGKPGEGVVIKAKEYEAELNGKIIFLKGNHDNNNSCKTIINGLLIEIAHKQIYLVHKPEHFNKDYEINFVGHVHDKWKFKRVRHSEVGWTDLINVGVDVWNFRPVNFDEIMKEYHQWKKTQNNS